MSSVKLSSRLARAIQTSACFVLSVTGMLAGCGSDGDGGTPASGGVTTSTGGSEVSGECDTGETLCSGICVNTQANAQHCGACGSVCVSGASCIAGVCTCPANMIPCQQGCVSANTDALNCGSCGNACDPGTLCVAGVCTCQGTMTECSGTCVNTQSDPANCGACGTVCPSGQVCSAGTCSATCTVAGQELCGASCVDLQSDPLHCGTCTTVCPAGVQCINGSCGCPSGQTLCGAACVVTTTDPLNCGACGTVCTGGQTCTNGVCTGGQGTGGASGTGGTTGSGGVTTSGGTTASGGTTTSGGTTSTGGTTTSGGTTATGGTTNTGGTTSTGGETASGGTTSTGGTTGTGGTPDASGCRVWVDTNGTDAAGCGAADSPCRTVIYAYDIVCPLVDGVDSPYECSGAAPRTMCIRPGTYAMTERFQLRGTRMGSQGNVVTIQGDPTSTTKPHLDFSSQPRAEACGASNDTAGNPVTGITSNSDWVVIKNLEVSGANDNCIKINGANNVVENVVVHDCADAGIQISSGADTPGTGTNNSVINCDSYRNNDVLCDGENADGFAVKEGTGTGNVFRGCRAWDNADDGWDLYAWTSPVTIENSWAMQQARTTEGGESDGNGFKLGGDGVSAQHIISNLIAVDNTNGSSSCGFTENSNGASMTCTGTCVAWGNGEDVDTIGGVSTTPISGVTSDAMINAQRGADGSLPDINSL